METSQDQVVAPIGNETFFNGVNTTCQQNFTIVLCSYLNRFDAYLKRVTERDSRGMSEIGAFGMALGYFSVMFTLLALNLVCGWNHARVCRKRKLLSTSHRLADWKNYQKRKSQSKEKPIAGMVNLRMFEAVPFVYEWYKRDLNALDT